MSHRLDDRITTALGAIGSAGPRELDAYLRTPGPDFAPATDAELIQMHELILSQDANEAVHIRFSTMLRAWDNTKTDKWTDDTPRNTPERRRRIHELLKTTGPLAARIDERIPFFRLEEPLIIAREHKHWYSGQAAGRNYYWSAYVHYLSTKKKWPAESLLSLDNSTRAVVECLSNPESERAYSSRGIVVGHVQSGKTANFAGVIARAADAGYRLIIVLGGTWNILRNQTQRRLDKELIGKEFLANDESYHDPHPADWEDFLEHGFDPTDRGHYNWERLTRPDIDYRRLKQAIDNLEFQKRDRSRPLYDWVNLGSLPVKLLVIKKNSSILENLVRDLKLLAVKLGQLPTLIIDDESDQAGINTTSPRRSPDAPERTKTNQRIVELLRLFPRGQYIGYTATPYANALVNPDDPEDLFPKDFFVSLEKPAEYMGVAEFFDPEVDYSDLAPEDFSQKEISFTRRVTSPVDHDDTDLKAALRSFVLAGAIKLYREHEAPNRYRFRHHTMLIHTARTTAVQGAMKARVQRLWDQCGFNCSNGLSDLVTLFEKDFRPVWAKQAPSELFPSDFPTLKPYIVKALQRIEQSDHVLVINSDRDSSMAPDFGEAPVWKVIIGGDKLSRGYTVEGLTTSYYRRVATTADTLMQMGRWFGFRAGYRDLVRVFLGVADGPRQSSDLVALFKEVCAMEERFRAELTRYVRRPGCDRITPLQLPPLISAAGQLAPTARNKMFNAKITRRNFGGRWCQPTLVAAEQEGREANVAAVAEMLNHTESIERLVLGGSAGGSAVRMDSYVCEITTTALVKFVRRFRWLEKKFLRAHDRPADVELQIEFLEKQRHGIQSWLVIFPQRQESFGDLMVFDRVGSFTIKQRSQTDSGRFGVFGELSHRTIAHYLAGIAPSNSAHALRDPNSTTVPLEKTGRGVMLMYLVRDSSWAKQGAPAIGFELLYPNNELPYDTDVSVRKAGEGPVVSSEG